MPEYTEHPRYNAKDADLRLISSDDVLFMVRSELLIAASPVFRDTLSLPQKNDPTEHNEIRLVDGSIEKAPTIEAFLDAVYANPLPTDLKEYMNVLPNAIRLAKKYEARTTLFVFALIARSLVGETAVSPSVVFLCGALLDDVTACKRALANAATWCWQWPEGVDGDIAKKIQLNASRKLSDRFYGASVLDLTTYTYDDYAAIPPRYTHALLCASRVSRSLVPGEAEWEEVAKEFERLMTAG